MSVSCVALSGETRAELSGIYHLPAQNAKQIDQNQPASRAFGGFGSRLFGGSNRQAKELR